tara:strand:- start:1556 stop:1900 length:345 start_codon:yes stop_codon:yes gene_type:complete
MNLAKQINKKLDEILLVQSQLDQIQNGLAPDAQLNNAETGEPVTKEIVLNKGEQQLEEIKEDLNKLTNNGESGRDLFTNQYYVNDFAQDKLIAEEIRLNKIEACLAEQNKPENN